MKNILGTFKLILPAGALTPSTLGPILGQYGLNLMTFCKEFNDKTKLNKGKQVRVKTIIFTNKTYIIKIYSLSVSSLILKSFNISKGSSLPNKSILGNLTKNTIIKLVNKKYKDLFPISKISLIKMIQGSAKSMGIY